MSVQISNVMVVGAGQMGTGIAQVFLQSGFTVWVHDLQEEIVERSFHGIEGRLDRLVEKGNLDKKDKEDALRRFHISTRLEDAGEADIVIEAAIENMESKLRIFRELDKYAEDHTILATNTSSLSITEIASGTKRPGKVIGMHFMNPVPVMELVEVIRGLATDDAVYETVAELARNVGKSPVLVEDFPGFVSNRILMPMINEAIFALYEGVAEKEAIDQVMKLGMNHPMGPLALADFIGLDTCLYIMETLYEGFGDNKYRPCPLLRKYVQAGWLGKKTGRGFYLYQ